MFIYKIHNLFNDKVYIGKTERFKFRKRKTEHFSALRHGKHYNQHLQRSWKKYGENTFTMEIIASSKSKEDLCELEKYYIWFYQSFDNKYGYNGTTGGEHGGSMSLESRQRMSKNSKGKPKTLEHRRKISAGNKGKLKGRKLDPEHIAKITAYLLTQVQSEETKKKRALKQTGPGNHRYGKCGPLSASYGKPGKGRKPVNCFDLNMNLIKEYPAICEVVKELKLVTSSGIIACCRGKQKTAHGFIFRYKIDSPKES